MKRSWAQVDAPSQDIRMNQRTRPDRVEIRCGSTPLTAGESREAARECRMQVVRFFVNDVTHL
jgi:hypothetical protein